MENQKECYERRIHSPISTNYNNSLNSEGVLKGLITSTPNLDDKENSNKEEMPNIIVLENKVIVPPNSPSIFEKRTYTTLRTHNSTETEESVSNNNKISTEVTPNNEIISLLHQILLNQANMEKRISEIESYI